MTFGSDTDWQGCELPWSLYSGGKGFAAIRRSRLMSLVDDHCHHVDFDKNRGFKGEFQSGEIFSKGLAQLVVGDVAGRFRDRRCCGG